MSEYLELVFDIFNETDQRAAVAHTITAAEMIAEIVREFEGLDQNALQNYGLYVDDGRRQLEPHRSLSDQGVQPGDHLLFTWASDQYRQRRKPVTAGGQYALQEIATQVQFPLEWQPAIIGRPDRNRAHNALLAVDLEWLPHSRRVSRRHAQITERGGCYYLESLAPKNPIFLNRKELAPGKRYKLKVDDNLTIGHSGINLRFIRKV